MSAKIATLFTLVSAALAGPLVSRASATGPGSVVLENNSGESINYALVPEAKTGLATITGTLTTGNQVSFPMSPDQAGDSLKLAPYPTNPQSSSGILQLEYTYDSASDNVSFDWSCVNCNPDPFESYARAINPTSPSSSCVGFSCPAGSDPTSCEFTSPTGGYVHACPATNGVLFTATIG